MININRRVVVTGLGIVCPVGNDINESWNNIKNGKNGIDFIKNFDPSDLKVKIAGEIKNFEPKDFIDHKEIRRLDKYSIYALAATKEAIEMAGLNEYNMDCFKLGTIVSSGIGGLDTLQDQIIKMHDKGPDRVSPFFIPMAISNMASGNIAMKYNAKGLNQCIISACASGANSIGEAFRNIKHGYIDACIAGASEASINKIGIAGFTSITALATCNDINNASIPFDKNRSGFVMGEGAGILILEDLEHAINRGANILAEIVGYGSTCDAFHMTAPDPEGIGATNAIINAINESSINIEEIDYINAHGTSTPHNDKSETKAIKNVFGNFSYNIPTSSTKSMTGHLLGAAGAIEAIFTIKSIVDDFLPPTINTKILDDDCDLDYVLEKGRNKKIKYALSNSLGFGGHNVVLCFKKWGE